MADVFMISAGRWGLSRPLFIDGGWTTYAVEQRLGLEVENFFPPRAGDGTPLCNAVLIRLVGPVTAPADGNTVLFPRNLEDIGDVTLGELTAAQRNALRNTLEVWLTGYTFTDWDGAVRVIPPFSVIVSTYTGSTTLKQVARDIYRHIAHSTDRPRLLAGELHNTQYLDNFDDSHETRWTALTASGIGNGVWDSVDLEVDFSGDQDAYVRYSANNSGSIEHEAQITGRHTGGGRMVGPGVRMSTNSGYGISVDQFGNIQIWKVVAGTRTNIYTSTSVASPADLTFETLRLAASGGNGANVVLDMWYLTHTTTKPSDPGWTGVDGTPAFTYTDTAADRLDDSAVDLDCGILARGMVASVDTRHDYFKLRAIADRGGPAASVMPHRHPMTHMLVR